VGREAGVVDRDRPVRPAGVAQEPDEAHGGGVAFLERHGEAVELVTHPARAHAEHDAAGGQEVQRAEHLGHLGRVPVGRDAHRHTEAYGAGLARHPGQRGEGIEEVAVARHDVVAAVVVRVARLLVLGEQQVVTHPQRLQAQRLGGPGELHDRRR
jgi:hypothetical protein